MTPLLDRCRERLRAGASVDDALGLMRLEGLSQLSSIKLLVDLTGMSLAEAKAAVHMSSVWADTREEVDAFHEQLEEAADQLLKHEPPSK
jgi:hypothetical protein